MYPVDVFFENKKTDAKHWALRDISYEIFMRNEEAFRCFLCAGS